MASSRLVKQIQYCLTINFYIRLNAQSSLRTGYLALLPRYPRRRGSDSNGKGLEGALGTMVVVIAPQAVNVQCDTRSLREALKAMRNHLAAKVADLFSLEAQLNHAERSI